MVIFIDIHSLKRDQDTLRRQAELLEHASEPTLMRELGGAIVYWNKAAERLYGYTREEALDRRGTSCWRLRRDPTISTTRCVSTAGGPERWSTPCATVRRSRFTAGW